jgi:hypothetical protein
MFPLALSPSSVQLVYVIAYLNKLFYVRVLLKDKLNLLNAIQRVNT